MKTSWNSIAESIVQPAEKGTLSFEQASESPCLTCQTTPCCTHLPLNTFKVTNLIELDHALYLLNFDRIELGVSSSGEWSVYYTYPCRQWDRETHYCKVHNAPEQPRICQHYNPYNCWYRRVFSVGQNEDFIRIDYDRMQHLLPHIEFDEDRQIKSVPEWDTLISLMEGYEDQEKVYVEPDLNDDAFYQWGEWVMNPEPHPDEPVLAQIYDPAMDPCTDCAAYCCKTLVFPQYPPKHLSNLDYYRFSLGFPGVELGMSDIGWSIIVKTRCRHLNESNQCMLYGKSERPLICKYYDAWKCDYKPQFGRLRPEGFLRVRLEQFQWLTENIPVDQDGKVLNMPQTSLFREHIENRWKESGRTERMRPKG